MAGALAYEARRLRKCKQENIVEALRHQKSSMSSSARFKNGIDCGAPSINSHDRKGIVTKDMRIIKGRRLLKEDSAVNA